MSKKLLVGAVAGVLALTPTVASAAGPANDRAKDAAVPIWQTECIVGSPGACPGYTYTCFSPMYPKQLAVRTNSDTTEDTLEHYLWRCYGTPDSM